MAFQPLADRAMSEAALEVTGLTRSFGGVRAVADLSFVVPDGGIAALIGPNGAGKTTVFNLVTNLFPADAGEVKFYGIPLRGKSPSAIAELGLLRTFQTARIFPGMTVLENVLAGAHRQTHCSAAAQMLWLPRARREEAALRGRAITLLDLVALSGSRDMPATSLPIGAQKLVEVCRAVMARPRLLLLDEPAAGLNDAETADLASLLRAVCDSGVTIIVVEHNMSLVMGIADSVIVLDLGRLLAQGTVAEIQQNPRVVDAYLGVGT
jgi:branched-chain amino acid transport system ATP-binding protein